MPSRRKGGATNKLAKEIQKALEDTGRIDYAGPVVVAMELRRIRDAIDRNTQAIRENAGRTSSGVSTGLSHSEPSEDDDGCT